MTVSTAGRAGSFIPRPGTAGYTLTELAMGLALLALLVTLAVPPVLSWSRRQRLEGAIRLLALELSAARWGALATGATTGLLFRNGPDGYVEWMLVRDGDGDGLRSEDLGAGIDFPLSQARRLGGGVRFGVLENIQVPRLPPQSGPLSNPADPVKFGRSNTASFSPLGSATAGSLYLHNGTGMAALVIHGVTGRLRLFRFQPEQRLWKEIS